jgi:ABC-2 type transport system permease protein
VNTVADFLVGARATVARDFRTFISYRLRAFTILLSQVFSLTLFYYVSRLVGGARAFATPDDYYAFAVVGLLILQVLNSTLGSPPGQLRGELMSGTFERVYLTPFGPIGTLVSSLLFPFVSAMLISAGGLTFAALAFGLDVHWSTLALAVPLGALGALAFMPFGILLLSMTIVIKQAAAGATWIIAGISLIAGLYVPISYLPDWTHWMSDVQPFTPAVDLLRHVIVDQKLQDPLWADIAKLVGFAAILLPLALLVLRAAIGRARKTGTIIEY